MRETSSTEFLEWIHFLNDENRETTKQEYYLAQLTAEVRRANQGCKNPNAVRTSDFVLTFGESKAGALEETATDESPMSAEERRAAATVKSKAGWDAILALPAQKPKDTLP